MDGVKGGLPCIDGFCMPITACYRSQYNIVLNARHMDVTRKPTKLQQLSAVYICPPERNISPSYNVLHRAAGACWQTLHVRASCHAIELKLGHDRPDHPWHPGQHVMPSAAEVSVSDCFVQPNVQLSLSAKSDAHSPHAANNAADTAGLCKMHGSPASLISAWCDRDSVC